MNENEVAMHTVLSKIDSLNDLLSDILPKTDKKHKDEILDICDLLYQRTEMYLNEYGVNEGVEV